MNSMSSMERLLSSSNKDAPTSTGGRTPGILFGAFCIFSVACFMFIGYVAIDHFLERQKLEAEIDKLAEQLKALESINTEDPELNKALTGMIETEQRCDQTQAIIKHMGKQMDSERPNYFEMWDNIPMSFLHLIGNQLKCEEGEGNVDGMKSVTGWETEGGDGCLDSNPTTDGTDIVIPRDGNYSVSTQITFYSEPGGVTEIHRHVVQYVEYFAGIRDDPKILMENAYQLSGGQKKVSYQSGVYRFNKDDSLRVLVQKSANTLFNANGDKNGAFFEVVLL